MTGVFSLAPAGQADLPDIAFLHVTCWQQAYIGQLPQSFLDGLDVAARLRNWQANFGKDIRDGLPGLVLARSGGKSAGFISYGRSRDEDRPGEGEIYAVYLLKEYWGKGLGFRLFDTAREALRAANINKAYLWVLDTNQNALEAYARWGGIQGRLKDHAIGGQPVREALVAFEF